MRFSRKIVFVACALMMACLAPCDVAHAAVSRATQDRRAADERREFASFVDGFLAGIQKEQHVPGMTFVAVRNGEILYLKGYGLADAAKGTPADPERTLYRVGSISKIMTAVAVLQLTERGRLGLDEDAGTYLRRWTLSDAGLGPVTLRNLLTHTGGFDDKRYEICAPTSDDERNFASRLPKLMPARYTAPGRSYSFSNMGYTLAGSIVERYSRQNFASAIKKYIFDPLGMEHSAFSPSEEFRASMAAGHDANGAAVAYAYRSDLPANGMVTTASDMGRFMLAQLGEGALGRKRILPAMYANSMLRRHFSPHPLIDGTGLAYAERNILGVRTLQQSGGIPGYSSFLMLVPDKKFGLFFAANIAGLGFENDLAEAVAKRFLLASGDVRGERRYEPAGTTEIPAEVEGWYRHNRISRHTAEKARNILGPQLRVAVDGDMVLLTRKGGAEETKEWWVPAGELDLFRQVDENGRLIDAYMFFGRDAQGAVESMTLRNVYYTYDRLPRTEAYPGQVAQIGLFLLTAAVSLLGLLLGLAINRNRLPWEKGLRSATELWTLSTLFCLMQAAFAVGLLLANRWVGGEFATFVPYQVKALFVIPLLAGILLAWLWLRFLASSLNPDHHWAEKLLLLAIVGVETGYMFFLANWRLLGFMF